MLRRLVQIRIPQTVIIVADNDGPGKEGAQRLADYLVIYCLNLKIITPDTEDLRTWVRAGAGRADVERKIREADSLRAVFA